MTVSDMQLFFAISLERESAGSASKEERGKEQG